MLEEPGTRMLGPYRYDRLTTLSVFILLLLLINLSMQKFVASAEGISSKQRFPLKREFLQFPVQDIPSSLLSRNLRILQLNMLADGLSGLRKDLGAFSRVTAEAISWENRKDQLMHEILQYCPDIITLQENDHYYDFFLPEMNSLGYDCFFAPKPASACLEVSDRSDGCSIFINRKKLKVVSSQVITYVLSKTDDELSEINKVQYAYLSDNGRA